MNLLSAFPRGLEDSCVNVGMGGHVLVLVPIALERAKVHSVLDTWQGQIQA